MSQSQDLMKEKTCLVSGGTNGIGLVTARLLAEMGAKIFIIGRDRSRLEAAVKQINSASNNPSATPLLADLSSLAEVRRVAGDFLKASDRLDVLVNNAGGFFLTRQVSVDGYEMTLALNHLNYFLLTSLLLGVLKATAAQEGEARVVNVASESHRGSRINFDDLQAERGYRFFKAYGQSKLANVLFTFELAKRLEGSSVATNALHPGFVATGIGKNNGFLVKQALRIVNRFATSPEEGAQTPVYLASSPEVRGLSGMYFIKSRPVRADPVAYIPDNAAQLWQISEKMISNSR